MSRTLPVRSAGSGSPQARAANARSDSASTSPSCSRRSTPTTPARARRPRRALARHARGRVHVLLSPPAADEEPADAAVVPRLRRLRGLEPDLEGRPRVDPERLRPEVQRLLPLRASADEKPDQAG